MGIKINQPKHPSGISPMYNKQSEKDWVSAVITATLGAGVVACFAIALGQHPLIAFSITGFAVIAALVVDQFLD